MTNRSGRPGRKPARGFGRLTKTMLTAVAVGATFAGWSVLATSQPPNTASRVPTQTAPTQPNAPSVQTQRPTRPQPAARTRSSR